MRNAFVGALAALLLSTPALAQRPAISITPYGGYMWFGELAEIPGGQGLTNDDNWLVGAQVGLRLGAGLSLFGNVAHTRTDFRYEDVEGDVVDLVSGELGYWLYDAGLELRFGQGSGLSPFLQAGGGAVRYTAERDDFESQGKTDLQFNFGGGVDLGSGPVGLRIMVKDYLTSLDWTDFEAFRQQVEDDDVDRSRVANNIAVTVGLRIGF